MIGSAGGSGRGGRRGRTVTAEFVIADRGEGEANAENVGGWDFAPSVCRQQFRWDGNLDERLVDDLFDVGRKVGDRDHVLDFGQVQLRVSIQETRDLRGRSEGKEIQRKNQNTKRGNCKKERKRKKERMKE